MRTLRRERVQLAYELVEELDGMRYKYGAVGIAVPDYTIRNMRTVPTFLCSFAATLVALFHTCLGHEQRNKWMFLTSLLLSVVMAIICIGKIIRLHQLLTSINDVIEIKPNRTGIRRLETAVVRLKKEMKEYQKQLKEMEPLIKKLKRLEPIIKNELGGEISVDDQYQKFYVRAQVGDRIVHGKISGTTYTKIIKMINAERTDRQLIQDFEATMVAGAGQ